MPKVRINGIEMNYLLEGTGQTIVLLNGIMMSAASWEQVARTYIDQGYKVLRLDFRDQGLSDSVIEIYTMQQHADDVHSLLKHLGLDKVYLLGISYGAQVAMQVALSYPEDIAKLILANATARVSKHLMGIGTAWEEAAKTKNGISFFKLAMPYIYSKTFYETNYTWLKDREETLGALLDEAWVERYLRLSAAFKEYNLLNEIVKIEMPTLIISSEEDIVTPNCEQVLIHEQIKESILMTILKCGHASFYEKSDEFNILVLGFLAKKPLKINS
ncbi:MAG: alpha/beta hydrolase [Clostridiales bacterium]|nr:alpha/beta hydrolase [Clostridiales bacterium]